MPPQRTILNALQDLTEEKFHEFCHELTALDEEPRVRTAEVEGKSRVVITKLLVSRYGQSEALSRTITTLRVIGCNDEAERLAKEADLPPPKRARSRTPPPECSAAGASAAPAMKGHFVDRHQIDLIKRVSNINPILDHLLKEEVLTQEQYDQARAIPTTQDKMRFLFRGPLKAGEPSKDELLSALEKEEKYLIKDLRGKSE
uniref:Apoptosis-associated speck-like protein containing a CARD n=1 Tax=Neogobius melanostomus TaxID=47308 RepID=A0A8C6SQM9_9GOBI